MTQTPASGPAGPVTTPAMSSSSIGIAGAEGWQPASAASARSAAPANTGFLATTGNRGILDLLARRAGSATLAPFRDAAVRRAGNAPSYRLAPAR